MKLDKNGLEQLIKQVLLEESYSKFKKSTSYRTKSEQLAKAIKEVKKRVQEVDKLVNYTTKMKQELSEGEGLTYWKSASNNISQISEMINEINNKVKNLFQ